MLIDSNKVGRRIRERREALNMTQEMLGEKLGLHKSTIQRYESGEVSRIKLPVVESIAKALLVSPEWLTGITDDPTPRIIADNIIPLPKFKKIPLLGTIACGDPILAAENLDGFVNCAEFVAADFALKCKGDSMINARIFDGDIVFIRQQPDVDDGEIAAVLISDEATLKRVHKYPNKLVLSPCNPMYDDFVYTGEQLNEIQILGKAVAFLSVVK